MRMYKLFEYQNKVFDAILKIFFYYLNFLFKTGKNSNFKIMTKDVETKDSELFATKR